MRTFVRTVLTVGVVVALAGTASAQRQPGGQGRGGFGGGFGGGGIGFLISSEAVQKELKMDKDQAEKATEAVKKVRDKHADDFAKLRDLPREEQRTKTHRADQGGQRGDHQGGRRGPQARAADPAEADRAAAGRVLAYTRPEVQTALKLNDEQKEKVKTITEEANKQIREAFGTAGPAARGRRAGRAGPAGARAAAGSGPTTRR